MFPNPPCSALATFPAQKKKTETIATPVPNQSGLRYCFVPVPGIYSLNGRAGTRTESTHCLTILSVPE